MISVCQAKLKSGPQFLSYSRKKRFSKKKQI